MPKRLWSAATGCNLTVYYYRCSQHRKHGHDAYLNYNKSFRARKVEPRVWEFASELLRHPNRLREDLEAMIEQVCQKLRGGPDREARGRGSRSSPKADATRDNYLMTLDEIRAVGRRSIALQELQAPSRFTKKSA